MSHALLSPRLVAVHVLALAAATAAVLLGLWQYDAWQAARAAEVRDLTGAPAEPLAEVLPPDAAFPGDSVGRPVRFAGEWVDQPPLLIADREHEDKAGYWVVSPFAVCSADCANSSAMLVVRGWTPQPDNTAAPEGRGTVTGWLQPPEGSGVPDPDPQDRVLPELRIADAIQHVDQDLYGGYVIAKAVVSRTAATGSGLEPVTPASLPEAETFTAWRNLLYAVEWWIFGAFALFVWWRWCRDVTGSTDRSNGGGSPADGAENTPLSQQQVASSR